MTSQPRRFQAGGLNSDQMKKPKFPEMMPTKKWLSSTEAMAYCDMGYDAFTDFAAGLRKSQPGKRGYWYYVDDLNKRFEKGVTMESVA